MAEPEWSGKEWILTEGWDSDEVGDESSVVFDALANPMKGKYMHVDHTNRKYILKSRSVLPRLQCFSTVSWTWVQCLCSGTEIAGACSNLPFLLRQADVLYDVTVPIRPGQRFQARLGREWPLHGETEECQRYGIRNRSVQHYPTAGSLRFTREFGRMRTKGTTRTCLPLSSA